MRPLSRIDRIAAVCVASLCFLASRGATVTAEVPSTAPSNTMQSVATQPAPNSLNDQQIVADIHALQKKLRVCMPDPGVLADPARRAAAAPDAIPLLRQMSADIEQLIAHNPAAKPKLAGQERQIVVYMATLGDPKSQGELAADAASADPAIALQGQMDQLAVRWTSAGKTAEAQDAIIADLEKLDKAHADNPDLAIFNYRLYQSAASPTEAGSLKALIANNLQSPVATKICQTIDAGAKLSQAADKPLVIAGKTVDGKAFSTKDWAGKVILVDFWASWCGPCRGELPRVKAMYDQYHANGLEVLGVSNDYSSEALTKFVAQDQLPWPQLFDAEAAAQQQFNPITLNQGITGIPVMFLIDRKGIVRSVTAREEMESLIPKLLAEPS